MAIIRKRKIDLSSKSKKMIVLQQNPIFTKTRSPIILRPRNTNTVKKKSISPPPLKKKKKKIRWAVKSSGRNSDSLSSSSSSSWVKSQLLGEGAFGSVYLATNKTDRDKTERAIKTAELSQASSLMDESRILIHLKSPFIIRLYDNEIENNHSTQYYNMILEYCSGKTIADLLESNQCRDRGLLETHVKFYARDVLSGLAYIHDRNIIHCDIKPDNLLLSPTDLRFRPNGYLTKIGDFGLAMEKGSIEYGNGYGHQRGTTRYLAPEVMRHGFIDFGVDVWALGCTVLEMLTGKLVWGEYGDISFEDWVSVIGHSNGMPQVPDWVSEEAKDFLSECLERDIYKRGTTYSLLKHPFVQL
ncbi:unnamed protein product [Cochlearia groenlandica]